MVIKKLKPEIKEPKKTNKKEQLPKEDPLDKIRRIRREKEADEKADAKQKIIDDAKELERQYSIIFPHLDKFNDHLKEKQMYGFWIFPYKAGAKKYNVGHEEIQEIIDKDPQKYMEKHAVQILINPIHRKKNRMVGEPLVVMRIVTFPIDKKGKLRGDKAWACVLGWVPKDFKITKISFRYLIESSYVLDIKFSILDNYLKKDQFFLH